MQKAIRKLNKEFEEIKENGWVKSVCRGNNGVGITFEKLLGISQNELEIPDFEGIEIKTRRYKSKSYITLFSSTPMGKCYHEVERIKNQYGYPHRKFKQYKVLNNSAYGNKLNKIGQKYYFKLKLSLPEEKIYLCVYDKNKTIIERTVYWDFDILKEKLLRKLSVVAIVKAYSKKIMDIEYFKYNQIDIYRIKSFQKFLDLLELGIIRVNFKLNIKTEGEKIGQIHDHGTSFDIQEENINKLYKKVL